MRVMATAVAALCVCIPLRLGFSLLGDARAMLALEGYDSAVGIWSVRGGVAWSLLNVATGGAPPACRRPRNLASLGEHSGKLTIQSQHVKPRSVDQEST